MAKSPHADALMGEILIECFILFVCASNLWHIPLPFSMILTRLLFLSFFLLSLIHRYFNSFLNLFLINRKVFVFNKWLHQNRSTLSKFHKILIYKFTNVQVQVHAHQILQMACCLNRNQ